MVSRCQALLEVRSLHTSFNMRAVTPLDLPVTPSVAEGDHKAFSLNLPRSTKSLPQKNLLANSLANKLKQHRHDHSSNKENLSKAQYSKLSKRSSCKVLPRGQSVSYAYRYDSASSSKKPAPKYNKEATLSTYDNNYKRVESASSEQLPKLATRKASSSAPFNPSRRSSSAEPVVGRASLYSGTARLTSASSFFHSSDSSGLGLESRGADYTIKVVKKDGVFQPIDKYASCRYLPREGGVGERSIACEYELFMLPVSYEDTVNAKQGSRDNYSDGYRRTLKVSWGKATDNVANEEADALENRMDSAPPPATPNNLHRALSSSSSSKRPIYSSGKSRVQSIGLRWRVPTAPPDEEEVVVTGQSPKKPMWSWLVTPEVKQKGRLKAGDRQLTSESKSSSQQCLSRVNSNLDVRTRHSRDLHPVATAMAREGTSVSKTKWLVPSSSASTLEPERVAMDRLELVKREGKIRSDNLIDMDETYKFIQPDDMDSNNSEDGDMGARKRHGDTTSYGTKSNVDSMASPAKSLSTYY